MQSLLVTSYEGRGTSAMRHYKLTHWHIKTLCLCLLKKRKKTLCLCVSAFYQSFLTFNSNFMENPKESVWSKVPRIVITILTAIATSLGVQSCM